MQAEASAPVRATATRRTRTDRHERKPDMTVAPRGGGEADRASLGADDSLLPILSPGIVFCDPSVAASEDLGKSIATSAIGNEAASPRRPPGPMDGMTGEREGEAPSAPFE